MSLVGLTGLLSSITLIRPSITSEDLFNSDFKSGVEHTNSDPECFIVQDWNEYLSNIVISPLLRDNQN